MAFPLLMVCECLCLVILSFLKLKFKKAYYYVLFISTTLTKFTRFFDKVAKTGFREKRYRQQDRRKRGKAKALLFFFEKTLFWP